MRLTQHTSLLLSCALLILLQAGCLNLGSYQRAKVLTEDQSRLNAQVSGAVIPDADQGILNIPVVPLSFSAGLAQGIGGGFEWRAGVQNATLIGGLGGFGGLKWQWLGDVRSRFAMALDLSANLTMLYFLETFALIGGPRLGAPVSVELDAHGFWTLSLDPALQTILVSTNNEDRSFSLLFSQALGLRIGPREGFGVVVEAQNNLILRSVDQDAQDLFNQNTKNFIGFGVGIEVPL